MKQLSALLVGLALLMAPADSHAQRELKIGTSKFGTLSNALAQAVAFVATLATPGTRFTPQAHTGSADVIPIVNSGEIEFGITLSAEAANPFTPAPDIRAIMRVSEFASGFLVRRDSPIVSIQDVRGKRVAGRFTSIPVFAPILGGALQSSAGFGWQDVREVPVGGVNEGLEALLAGRVDVAAAAPAAGAVREANASVGIRYLQLDCSPGGQERFRTAVPRVSLRVVRVGVLTEDTCVIILTTTLFAHAALPAKPVQEILRAVWEGYGKLTGMHPAFRGQEREYMFDPDPPRPYHPAAVEFYREHGLWSKSMDAVQRQLLKSRPH